MPLQYIFTLGLPVIVFALFILLLLQLRRRVKEQKEKKQELSVILESFHEVITKLKRQEEQLKHLKLLAEKKAMDAASYSENILESVPSGVVSFDRQLRITKINRAAIDVLKLSKENVVGRMYDEVFTSPLKEFIAQKQAIRRKECLYRNAKGQELWLGLSMNELKDASGNPLGFILVFSDITDVKALERQLRLKEHLTGLGEISMGIAHELKNPMAVIMGYIKILSKKFPDSAELRVIQKEVQVMDRIISDFMSFAKPSSVNLQLINVKDFLEETITPVVMDRKDIETVIECHIEQLRTDSTLLRQAIVNLVKNAIEAMPDGGKLVVSATKKDAKVIIEVSDTGYGISEDIREKVFMPFFTKKQQGTGLGLAIVQKNITLLDGTVDFESSVNGTTFRIQLPLK